jgi:hypothetical protein
MRKIQFGFILMAAVAFISCGKENPAPPTYSSVLLVNAAVTSVSAPASSLYVDDSLYASSSSGVVLYNSNTGYLGVVPGSHVLKIKQEVLPPAQPLTIGTDAATSFGANEAYTLVAYDSLSTSNSIKLFKVKDDLTVPDVNSAKVRVWQLAPNFPSPVDVTYLRTSITPNDSVTITNRAFPGANPVVADLQAFTTIPSGTYTLKFKSAGTQTVVVSLSGLVAGRRKIYSHYLTGTAQGRPLAFGQVVHF